MSSHVTASGCRSMMTYITVWNIHISAAWECPFVKPQN